MSAADTEVRERCAEPTYVQIYCATYAKRRPSVTLAGHGDEVGRCFAQKVEGRWRCCCCDRPVNVAW